MSESFHIEFPGTAFEPLELQCGVSLAIELTALNSPILFGCRSGICGTCLVEVESAAGALADPSVDEAEAVELFAPGNPQARLACQLQPTGNLRMRKIEPC